MRVAGDSMVTHPATDNEARAFILEHWPHLADELTEGYQRYRNVGQSVEQSMRSICYDLIAEYERQNPPAPDESRHLIGGNQ